MRYIVTNTDVADIVLNEMNEVQQVLQSVSTILNTWKGSVPLHRDFGIDADLLHKPINMVEDLIIADIIEVIEKYEPRAEVINVDLAVDKSAPDAIKIAVELEINAEAENEVEEVVS